VTLRYTTRKETKTSVTNQEETISFLTNKHETSSSMHEVTTVFATSLEGTSLSHVRTQQGQSAFITTQVSPTTDQNCTHIRHHSLVVVVGHSISLSCSSPVDTVFRLGYCHLGCHATMIIYNGVKVTRVHITARMSVNNCDARKCTFRVDNLQLDAAGSFTCMLGTGDTYWSLTILGKKN